MKTPIANTDSSVRGRILDALAQGGPLTKFDHIVAAAAVEALIVEEKKKAVEEAFRLSRELPPEGVVAKMFPPLLEWVDEIIRRSSSPAPKPPSAG